MAATYNGRGRVRRTTRNIMISKRIDRKPENDNYGALANYVRDAKHTYGHGQLADYIGDTLHGGEKVLYSWHAGCLSDDYDLALREVQATQTLNTRSRKEKTYHLVISFRPEDEDKLTEEVFRDIELSFAKALGFEEHQRHCGVHKNTDNLHIHVAYNMIHPVTLARHEPYRDFRARDKVCREMERKYGLSMDNGREQERGAARTSSRAQAMEAQTGQESFISYVQRQIQEIQAGDWQTFHTELARKGIGYRLRGNGAIFTKLNGKTNCKASRVGREFSRAALERKYGSFQDSRQAPDQVKAEQTYDKAPRQASARRSEHWQRYKEIRETRKKEYEALNADIGDNYVQLRARFRQDYGEISTALLTRKDRARLYSELKFHKKQAFRKLRAESYGAREALMERYPATWTQYLQREAEKGDETALELLRAQAAREAMEKDMPLKSRASVKEALKKLAAMNEAWKASESWISKKGTVVVRLNCGELREYEDSIFLRPAAPDTKETLSQAALQFAEIRWGQEQALAQKKENSIARVPEPAPELARAERVR